MGEKLQHRYRELRVLESVSCLECGSVYAKPAGGGTAATNPGCPECGYLGWLGLSSAAAPSQLRSVEDRLPRRYA
jgi:predicted  nucleic acid-binding Zn-ribbon protein